MPAVDIQISREQSVKSGPSAGNGNDNHIPVGRTATGDVLRGFLRADINWDALHAYQINGPWKLCLRTTDEVHIAFGGTPRTLVRRLTESFTVGGGTENNWATGASTIYPGSAATATGEADSGGMSAAHNNWIAIDITDLVEAWAPATVLRRNGSPCGGLDNFGMRLASANEAATTSSVEYYGVRSASSNRPYVHGNFDNEFPPGKPVLLQPPKPSGGGPALMASASGLDFSIRFKHISPANAFVAADVQILTDAATDGTPGPRQFELIKTTDNPAFIKALGGNVFTFSFALGTSYRGTNWRYRLRVQGANGKWSAWTSTTDGRFRLAYIPGVPLNPLMTADPTAPTIAGTLNGPGTISGWQGEFYEDLTGGTRTLWAPGMVDIGGSSTRSTVNWGGESLVAGMKVRWRHRHRNQDGIEGTWSPFYTTQMAAQRGPTVTPPDANTRLTSRTASIGLTFPSSSDGYQYRLYRGTGDDAPLIHDSGLVTIGATTSTTFTLPLDAAGEPKANWADLLEIEPAARPAGTGALGVFANRSQLQLNTLPSTTLTASDGADHRGLIIPTLDVLWESPISDPDILKYGDLGLGKELEIHNAATPQGSGTLIERRISILGLYDKPENERTGRRLDLLQTTVNTTPDTNVAAATYGATNPTGYSGNSLEIQFTGASAVDRGCRKVCEGGTTPALSLYGGETTITMQRRVTSETNLVRMTLRFEFATTSDWAEYAIYTPGAGLNTWALFARHKMAPFATNGTVNWSLWSGVVRFFADVSGAYTGNLEVRDLRFGTTQSARDVPDGDLAPESSYDVRGRYLDTAEFIASTTLAANFTAPGTNVKVASVTGLRAGQELTLFTATVPAFTWQTRTITTVGTAGGGGTGVTVDSNYLFSMLSGDYARVYPWGPWTAWITRKVSLPPVVAGTAPADRALVTDPTPDFVHTYSSPGGKLQLDRTLYVLRRLGAWNRVIAMDPASAWTLSEAAGSFADTEGVVVGTDNGTTTNAATPGPFDPADPVAWLDLDGTTGYVSFGDTYDFTGTAPFSAGVWVRRDTAGTNPRVWSKEAAADGWALYIDNATATVRAFRTVASVANEAATTGTAPVGEVHLVGISYDGANTYAVVDGVMSLPVADARSLPGNTNLLKLGRHGNAGTNFLDGKVGAAFIFDRALTAAEWSALYAGRLEAPGDQLIYSRAADGTGTTDTGPALLLATGQAYAWTKTVRDTDELDTTTAALSFSTRFATPAAVTNLVGTPNPETGLITWTWDASVDANFHHYRVYERTQSGDFVRIDGGPTAVDDGRTRLTVPILRYRGQLGVNAVQVTVHTGGDVESPPADATASLNAIRGGSWQIVREGDERYTFAIDPVSVSITPNAEVVAYRPPGRGEAIHHHWGTGGLSISLQLAYVPTEDGDLAARLGEMLGRRTGPALPAWLVPPPGYGFDPVRVVVVDAQPSPTPDGRVAVSVSFDETPVGA